jgi:hypothetical protein
VPDDLSNVKLWLKDAVPALWSLLILVAALAADYWLLFGQKPGLQVLGSLALPTSLCAGAVIAWILATDKRTSYAARLERIGNWLIAAAAVAALAVGGVIIVVVLVA